LFGFALACIPVLEGGVLREVNKPSSYLVLSAYQKSGEPFGVRELMMRSLYLFAALSCLLSCEKPAPEIPKPSSAPIAGVPEKPKSATIAFVGNLFQNTAVKPSVAATALRDELMKEKLTTTVFLGDSLVTTPESEADQFIQGLFVDLPGQLYAVLGEQEYGNRSLKHLMSYERLFRGNRASLPPPFPARAITSDEVLLTSSDPLGRWYSIKTGTVLIVILDAEVTEEEGWQFQLSFLKKTLALAELPRTGVDIKHVFIALHRSPFSAYGKEETRIRDQLAPIWTASPKVRAVLSAHSPAYERFSMNRSRDGTPLSDLLYVVAGTGGLPSAEPSRKGFAPEISFGSTGSGDGLLSLTTASSFLDPTNGAPGAKKPIYGYSLFKVSAEGNIEYSFVPVAVEGSPAWASDSCTYGGGYLRWECKKL
jgi:hypothetical protein